MRINILLLSLLVNCSVIFTQTINISVNHFNSSSADLYELEGENKSYVDSVISQNGIIKFNLLNTHIGLFRLQLDKNHWVDFVNNGKDIEIKTLENLYCLP